MREPGAPIFGGLNLMIDAHWPREHVGDEVYSYRGHPLYQWAYRTLMRRPAPPTIERGRRILRDKDPVLAGRDLYCSPRQFEELKRAIAQQRPRP